jgi:hypothetical protein
MSSTGRLRIVSKGTGQTTRVFLVRPDGSEEDVTRSMHLTKVSWGVDGRGKAKAVLTCEEVELDVEAEQGLPPRVGTHDWVKAPS